MNSSAPMNQPQHAATAAPTPAAPPPAAGTPDGREPGWFRLWWQSDRVSLLRTIALIVALVSYAFLWPSLIEVGGARLVITNIALHLFVAVWLMTVSVGVRSIGSRDVLGAYLLGTFLVPTLVFFPLIPVISQIGSNSDALGVWWVPPMEECAILAGVALIAWRLYRRRHRRPGLMDLIVIGWSVGSGYAIHEDALYGRVLANVYSPTVSAAFSDAYGWIFPTFAEGDLVGASGVTTYHAGSGLVYGFVLAAALLLRPRVKHLMWLLPAVWLYMTVSHSLYNHQVYARALSPWRYVDGTGHTVAVLTIVIVPVALLFDYGRRQKVALQMPAAGFAAVAEAARRGTSPLRKLARVIAAARYHRGRNGAINAVWRDKLDNPDLSSIERWAIAAFAEPSDAADLLLASRPTAGQAPGQPAGQAPGSAAAPPAPDAANQAWPHPASHPHIPEGTVE